MEAGTRIGSYEIIAPIDAGGMGVVYRARHVDLGREVAIKILASNLMLSEKIRDRFKQEAYVQAQLVHPHIVQVSDSVHTEKHSAIVMEYVDGGSLANKLDEKPGAWSEADFRAVFGPIVEGVAYAHGRGVVHRDIKPENVLLTTDGTPKVADFGIAKILAGDSHMTRTGAKLGTVPYMAPEQYDGKTDLGTEADVYALGMLAWRMLTGGLPVDGDSAKAVYEHYTGARALPSIAAEVEGLSPGLARLIDGCLQVDRQQRPKDAGVMQKLLGATSPAKPRTKSSEIPATKPDRADENPVPRPSVYLRHKPKTHSVSKASTPESTKTLKKRQRSFEEGNNGPAPSPINKGNLWNPFTTQRMSRRYYFVFYMIISAVAKSLYELESAFLIPFGLCGFVIIMFCSLARLRDIGYSLWWYLLLAVFGPYGFYVFFFICLFGSGTNGPNKYGPDPRTVSGTSNQQSPAPFSGLNVVVGLLIALMVIIAIMSL